MKIEVITGIPNLSEIKFQSNENVEFVDSLPIGSTVETVHHAENSAKDIMLYLYVAITLILVIRYGLNLARILMLTKNSQGKKGSLNIVNIEGQKDTSSFFNYLFINPNLLEETGNARNIIIHESIHAKQLHTLDVLFIELLSCVFWFNPFVWLYKREIRENHEFIADDQVVRSGVDLESYANSIIYSGSKMNLIPFSSGFNFIHIKNRLLMLQQSKSSVLKRTLKSVIAVTLFAAVFTLSSFSDSKPQLVVVIDAGHGGHDSGNLMEKDVVLQISKKLAFYRDQKIKIIEMRSTDEYLGLAERVKFVNGLKPDLMISLHCNADQNTDINGVEAFYYNKNDHQEESHLYSKIIVESQLGKFSDRGEIKTAGFYILKNIDCPGVVLELGFITNESDKATLTNDQNQESIAKSLYESLLKIRETKNN